MTSHDRAVWRLPDLRERQRGNSVAGGRCRVVVYLEIHILSVTNAHVQCAYAFKRVQYIRNAIQTKCSEGKSLVRKET